MSQDYVVNAGFRMGGPSAEDSRLRDAAMPPTPVADGIAPATMRMMGRSGTAPLMSPVEMQKSGEDTKLQGHRQEPPKQFHRKSLGDWDFLETVGAGSMGKVKLARHHNTQEICAIKIVNRATKAFLHREHQMAPPTTEQEVLERQRKIEKEISRDKRTIREASLGQIFYHPHICRLFEVCTMSNHFYMLFEYVQGGQLLDYIIQHGSLREHHARKFARGIASALRYLHANNIVHRDLKIENIMISATGEIKLIDFGLSNVFDVRKQLHTFCGSLYFAAPELLKAHPYIGPEVDVWSFGVVLYVLVCGKVPFDDENSSVLHEKIKQGDVKYPQFLSIEVISLLSKMLVVDPLKRANLKQVVEHPWLNRGYDAPPSSYVPNRAPLTPETIDSTVLKEMFRLEFIEDVEEARKTLTKIITEPTYIQLSQRYWSELSALERKYNTSTGITSNTAYNMANTPYLGNTFEDPTAAYNPMLSIYYLVSEMLARKLAKLQRRQQQQVQKRSQIQALDPPPMSTHTSGLPVSRDQSDAVIEKHEKPIDLLPTNYRNHTPPPQVSPNMPQSPLLQSSRNMNHNVAALNSPPALKVEEPENIHVPKRNQEPLKIIVPPKLSMPEQAHTSPTSRKSSDMHNDLQNVFSPGPTDMDFHQQIRTPSPEESVERNKFGGIFRKISQGRHKTSPNTHNQPHIQIQPATEPTRNTKTHTRTVSEYVPPHTNITTYGTVPQHSLAFVKRSTSQKHSNNSSELPALPTNAEQLVQQQRQMQMEKEMQRLRLDANHSPRSNPTHNSLFQDEGTNDDIETDSKNDPSFRDEDNPLPAFNIAKGRRLHPSARAKSVGHARRESLKFMRPPVPNVNNNNLASDHNDHGFLQNFDQKSDTSTPIVTSSSSRAHDAHTMALDKSTNHIDSITLNELEQEMSDEDILAEASKAPPGSMPSIDYPRSLFLKGFFSVQTTSSKPLPIVRYKIMFVLRKMNIDFKEVRGGFVCTQKNPYAETVRNCENLPPQDADELYTQSASTKPYPGLSIHSIENPAAAYKGAYSSTSRHSSLRRQGSTNQNQLAVPTTPLSGSEHSRNVSINTPTLGFGRSHGRQVSVSGDLSAASLENVNIADDMLTNSIAQEMNRNDFKPDDINSQKDRPPLKFEIHIVKVRIVGLAGVHFKKVSGNTWLYKELASHILKELNL